jgi:hypothetical protein
VPFEFQRLYPHFKTNSPSRNPFLFPITMDWRLHVLTPPKLEFKQNIRSVSDSDARENGVRSKKSSVKSPACRVWTSHLGKTRISTAATTPKKGKIGTITSSAIGFQFRMFGHHVTN